VKRALIFDFDGLILDTEWPEYQAWKKVFEGFGLELPITEWMHVVGGPDLVDFKLRLEERLGRALDWKTLDAGRMAHHQVLMAEEAILPGVRELMMAGAAAGWRIGVASSSSSQWVLGNLRRLGLDSWV
jgi:beta-phosphoglucomutase-like phosphatase (HAD superfamily)